MQAIKGKMGMFQNENFVSLRTNDAVILHLRQVSRGIGNRYKLS
jgi:hypothetical protein